MNDNRVFIFQYIPDLFRQETVNVGVVFVRNERLAARFFAESKTGTVQLRDAARKVNHPPTYRQWVQFWRRELPHGLKGLDSILAATIGHFKVIDGGEVANDKRDQHAIADELFSVLVSDPAREQAEKAGKILPKLLKDEFRKRDIFTKTKGSIPYVKHPIEPGEPVYGKVAYHTPTFRQDNGVNTFIHAVELPRSQLRSILHDRAAGAAFMFDDLREAKPGSEMIAVLGYHKELDKHIVKNAKKMLQSSAKLVIWNDESDRDKFLEEREKVALGV